MNDIYIECIDTVEPLFNEPLYNEIFYGTVKFLIKNVSI